MKKKNEITLDTMDHKIKQFWDDVKDVQKKLEKRDIKRKVKLPEYCIHGMTTETKQ